MPMNSSIWKFMIPKIQNGPDILLFNDLDMLLGSRKDFYIVMLGLNSNNPIFLLIKFKE